MLKIKKADFLSELTAELAGYEEITKELLENYMVRVSAYIENQKGKNKKIQEKQNEITISLEDESAIFNLVDEYLVAVIDNETDLYWASFKL